MVLDKYIDINDSKLYDGEIFGIFRRIANMWSVFHMDGLKWSFISKSWNEYFENPNLLFNRGETTLRRYPDLILVPGILGGSHNKIALPPNVKFINQQYRQNVANLTITPEI
jgi:hypothetical protein